MIQLIRSERHGRSPYVMLHAVETFWEIFRDCKTLGFLQRSWRLSIGIVMPVSRYQCFSES